MKQLTRELKSVLTTGYNIPDNMFYIEYWNTTQSNIYVCNIYWITGLICRIKYKRHWNYPNRIEEKNIREWNITDKNYKNMIKRAWKKYA